LSDVRAGRYTLIESLSADLDRIAELVEKYDDLPLGTVDTSVIALVERLNITTVVLTGKFLDHPAPPSPMTFNSGLHHRIECRCRV
jgi:hypothetical protein